ncbi:orotate phosphoribosyltransferase, partial [bacterium]|nr:orotate phosphoribosyltransferase [bacterium]
IANAVALISYQKGKPVKSFSVRESIKDHGIIKKIEGDVKKGNRAVIIDDVITTGASTIKAITSVKDAGLDVVKVIALVDREEGGKEEILKHIKDFESIITRTRLMEAFNARQLKKRSLPI